jgi:hypothetical protein
MDSDLPGECRLFNLHPLSPGLIAALGSKPFANAPLKDYFRLINATMIPISATIIAAAMYCINIIRPLILIS